MDSDTHNVSDEVACSVDDHVSIKGGDGISDSAGVSYVRDSCNVRTNVVVVAKVNMDVMVALAATPT